MACIASGPEEIKDQQQCLASSSTPKPTSSTHEHSKVQHGDVSLPPSEQDTGQPSSTETAQNQPAEHGWSLLVADDASGTWKELRNLPPGGALLIRPDGHIAWRCESLAAMPAISAESPSSSQSSFADEVQDRQGSRQQSAVAMHAGNDTSSRDNVMQGLSNLGNAQYEHANLHLPVGKLATEHDRAAAESLVSDAMQELLYRKA